MVPVTSVGDIDGVFHKLRPEKVGALIVPPSAFSVTHRRAVIDMGARSRVPSIYGDELFVRDGGLICYWTSTADIQRRLGRTVGLLLEGKKRAEIPVQQPSHFKLIVNVKTADALGLKLSPSLLFRADEIIR
jgi:putative ABC transport system substrate-binding protein